MSDDLFGDINDDEEKLLKALRSRPITEVIGLVDSDGASSSCFGSSKKSTFSFTLCAWRDASGVVRKNALRVIRKASDREVDNVFEAVESDEVLRLSMRVAADDSAFSGSAMLVEVLGPDNSDQELNELRDVANEAVTYMSKKFGAMTLDRSLGQFSGRVVWNGETVTLHLDAATEGKKLSAANETARALWRSPKTWEKKLRAFAATKLLKTKNQSWLEEDEEELTAPQFGQRLQVTAIETRPNGAFLFWFDDGDLFWGHSICVRGTLKTGLKDAEIVG